MKLKKAKPHLDIVVFIKDVLSYLYNRIRFVLVIALVIFEVILEWTSGFKRIVIRYLFWGRGPLYRFAVLAAIGTVVFVMPFTLYRKPITSTVLAEENVYATIAQNDLLIEQGSVQTLIPKDRSRNFTTKYTVKGGDTLGQIATDNAISTETLMWANDLSEGDFIKPGQVLNIPPGDGVLHTVVSGDTVASLAEKYKASEQGIIDVNWLDYPFELVIDQVVFIPDGVMPQAPKPVIAETPVATLPTYGGSYEPVAGRFLGWPVAGGGSVTGCYTGWHNGIDIADASWPTLVAAAPGVVTFAGCQSGSCPAPGYSYGGYGLAWTVVIDHGNGFSSAYGHMNAIYVYSGQWVSAGQAIGQMGASGTAYGTHVHFMLLMGSSWNAHVNPAPYMLNSVCGW